MLKVEGKEESNQGHNRNQANQKKVHGLCVFAFVLYRLPGIWQRPVAEGVIIRNVLRGPQKPLQGPLKRV